MKNRAKVIQWFESQPRTDKGFNVLHFLPRLPSILDKLQEEPYATVRPFHRCRSHRELGLELPIQVHPVFQPSPHLGWTLVFHFWLNDRGHQELKQYIERMLENPYWHLEFEEELTNHVLYSLILPKNMDSNVTVELCEDYGTIMIPLPKGETWRTFKLEICPKCGEIGKPFAVEKPSGSVYLYHRHYDIDWKPIHACYIKVLKSSKRQKEKCPVCNELGMKYIDKKGYVTFWHYKNGKRIRHYIGKQ